jgi:two-component system OmpR family response regulator
MSPTRSRKQLLIVDGDRETTQLLVEYMDRYGYAVRVAHTTDTMRSMLQMHRIDLLVLDTMVPGIDGNALTREIRSQSQLPIIILTAQCSPCDRVLGLESGADDFVGKPFEPRELVSRVQSVLRRSTPVALQATTTPSVTTLCFDGWELHYPNRCLYAPNGRVLPLSAAEFRMMCAFAREPRRVFSREQLMERVHERTLEPAGRSIDLLVSRLRQKLDQFPGGKELIKTVRGNGYRFTSHATQTPHVEHTANPPGFSEAATA